MTRRWMIPEPRLSFSPRACALLVLAVAAVHASRAGAQAIDLTDSGRYLSQGVLLPPTSIATEQSPFALELNPAGLLFGPTGLAYLHEDGTTAETNARRSDGVFLRLGGLTAGDEAGIAVGFSLEWIRPTGGGCPPGFPCIRRTSLGVALGVPKLSLGLAYRWYNSPQDESYDDLGTFDVGLLFRPTSWLSAALDASALNAPNLGDFTLPRVYSAGLGLRPWQRWLTLAVDYSVDDRGGWRSSRLSYLADLALPRGLDLMAQLAHEIEEQPTGRHLALQVGLKAVFGYGDLELAEGNELTNGTGGFSGVIAAQVWTARGDSLVTIDRSAELLDLRKELAGPSTLASLLGMGGGLNPYTRFVLHLEQMEADKSLDTLIVEVRGLDGVSLGRVEELRARLSELRARGKRVIVWLESPGDTEYYLATAADRIYVAPEESLQINGLSTTHLFFRHLLDKLGVVPEFVKIGAYKSAPEEFTSSSSSGPAAEQTESLLEDEYDRYVTTISEARHIDPARMRQILSEGVFTTGQAVKAGLVDGLNAGGSALLAPAEELAEHTLRLSQADFPDELAQQWGEPPAIAVVEVIGDIMPASLDELGRSEGADGVVRRLRAAMRDSSVKAIVLRVDSPGGDVGASELIYQAVVAAQKVKPVIASFGDVAASGGYYIASPAGTIIAEPSTITGSIGVFAGKADLSKLLDKVGITTETFKRGQHADFFTLTREWTPEERKIAEQMVASFYETFLTHVASGRKMTRDQVDAIARGRVWTGAQARARGLVDHFGGLEDALREARRQGRLSPDARVVIPGARGLFDLPDLPKVASTLEGSKETMPPLLSALRELLSSAGEREALVKEWLLVQGLLAGRPLALAVDVPVSR